MGYAGLLFSLWNLIKNEFKTEEQIHKIQQKKLRKLLNYAYNNSVYYRREFEKAGITGSNINSVPFSSFPLMDKEQLMANFNEVVTDKRIKQEELVRFDKGNNKEKLFKGEFHIVHSSGSTGTPRYFVYDSKAWEHMLTGITRGAFWGMGIMEILKLLKSKPKVLYIAATDGRYGGAMAVGDGIRGLKIPQLFLDINTPISKWKEIVQDFAPDIIIGYPSAVKMLAEEINSGKEQVSAKRVISCGEPLALGAGKSAEDGMYLFDDMNIVEIIDGEMYITCLYNYVQPLIRYHISDKIKPREKSLNPVCSFTNVDVLLCRDEDVMWFMKEDSTKEFIHPLSVEGMCIDGLLDYQFVQTSRQGFKVLAEIKNTVSKVKLKKELKSRLDMILQEKDLEHVLYEISFVKSIKPDASTGKKRLIVIKET